MCDSRIIFALNMALATIGGTLFVIFACNTIPPFNFAKDFDSATCTVASSLVLANICCVSLSYDGSCSEPYPCVRVMVTYDSGPSAAQQLYYDFEAAVYQGDNGTCSYYHCPTEYESALDKMTDFRSKYGGVGDVYTCHRSSSKGLAVIQKVELLEVILTNLVTLVIFTVGLTVGCMAYYGKCGEVVHHEEDEEEEALDKDGDGEADKTSSYYNGSAEWMSHDGEDGYHVESHIIDVKRAQYVNGGMEELEDMEQVDQDTASTEHGGGTEMTIVTTTASPTTVTAVHPSDASVV